MNTRLLALFGAFDQNGVYGQGSYLPWSNEIGRSKLKLDMGRLVRITRELIPQEGKQNVLIMGRGTIESMGWRPLPGRHTIVLTQTLSEAEANAKVPADKSVAVARNVNQAVDRALSFDDCGHIFFFGGETVWLEALNHSSLNAAFITVVMCNSVARSVHNDTPVRRLPEMLKNETFKGMERQTDHEVDLWDGEKIPLEFRNYRKW